MGLIATALSAALLVGATGDLARLRPPPAPEELLGSQTAWPLVPGQFAAGVTASYARDPVVWRYPDGTYDPVVSSQILTDIGIAAGILPDLDLGVVLPVAVSQRGVSTSLSGLPSERRSMAGAGLGDLRLVPRYGLVRWGPGGLALALAAEVTLPTGDAERFRGEGTLSVTPRLLASLPFESPRPWDLTASVGFRARRSEDVGTVTVGNEIELRAGALFDLTARPVSALVEVGAVTSARSPVGGGLLSSEVLAGLRTRVGVAVVTLGGAVGLTQGVGTPQYRAILSLGWAPVPADRDGDGIPDTVDRCPDDPEDLEGIEDGDGCPEGRVADSDLGEPEDETPENCPPVPPGVSTVRGFDGCPLADTDQDGVPDIDDKCPGEKETINGIDDDDGCPDEGVGLTEYVAHVKIDLKATILFETGKAAIKSESRTVLDQVALQILAHPEVRQVRIEGHTDSIGPADDNLYLSQDRADAVRRYLVKHGVSKERLMAVGYGETRPLASNDTSEGRTKNRRVEFVIVE